MLPQQLAMRTDADIYYIYFLYTAVEKISDHCFMYIHIHTHSMSNREVSSKCTTCWTLRGIEFHSDHPRNGTWGIIWCASANCCYCSSPLVHHTLLFYVSLSTTHSDFTHWIYVILLLIWGKIVSVYVLGLQICSMRTYPAVSNKTQCSVLFNFLSIISLKFFFQSTTMLAMLNLSSPRV